MGPRRVVSAGGTLADVALEVGPDLAQLRALRAQLRTVLQHHPDVAVGDTELICTELSSNAIRQTAGPVRIRVCIGHDAAHIEVEDADPMLPIADVWAAGADGDLISWLLGKLATRWDWTTTVIGKVVWAELPLLTASAEPSAPFADPGDKPSPGDIT